MALMPIIIAAGNLAMGELRTLDPILIPFYGNLSIGIIGFIVCMFQGFYPSQEDIEQNGIYLFWLLAFFCNGLSMYICW